MMKRQEGCPWYKKIKSTALDKGRHEAFEN